MLRAIASDNFPPFGKFRLKIPPVEDKPPELAEVHLLTGVNGTGKTRLLSVIASILGERSALRKRVRGVDDEIRIRVTREDPDVSDDKFSDYLSIKGGDISWGNESNPVPRWAKNVSAFAYSGTPYVTDSPVVVMADISRPTREECLSFSKYEDQSKTLLQAIANLKIQAAMDSMNGQLGDHTPAIRIVQKLEAVIQKITGHPFLFKVASYPKTSLIVSWAKTDLPFDLLPDGLRSLIGWFVHAVVMMDVWLQGSRDPFDAEAIFLLDEIESPLHPAWQRRILPAFQSLFPKAQIFMATHSPFVISSLNHGWIHPLSLKLDGGVSIGESIRASSGDSYISVVEDIMGVRELYDPETEHMLADFRQKRDAAYEGSVGAEIEAKALAAQIGSRSAELDFMMGRELNQMNRQLSKRS